VHAAPHKYKPAAVRTHLELLAEELLRADAVAHHDSPPRVFIGGDFNALPHELALLQREMAALGAYRRLVPPGPTGLSADFSAPETIDHTLISPGLRLVGSVELERTPSSPYMATQAEGTAAAVAAPSDHVWQSVRVALD
jgi:hypothetical protein